jgi:H+/gluconate symporter-like permease
MKKINSSVSVALYVIAIINFILPSSVFYYEYELLGKSISPFWITVIILVIGLYFAYRGKKSNESKGFNNAVTIVGIVLLALTLLYFVLFAGL